MSLALASDGLLAGGNSLTITTRGYLRIITQMFRRRSGGSGSPVREIIAPKQKILYQAHDDTEEILLIMTII